MVGLSIAVFHWKASISGAGWMILNSSTPLHLRRFSESLRGYSIILSKYRDRQWSFLKLSRLTWGSRRSSASLVSRAISVLVPISSRSKTRLFDGITRLFIFTSRRLVTRLFHTRSAGVDGCFIRAWNSRFEKLSCNQSRASDLVEHVARATLAVK